MLQNEAFVSEPVAAAVLVRVGLRSLGSRRFVWFLLIAAMSWEMCGSLSSYNGGWEVDFPEF